jgi:hypothetical protein
MNRVQPKMNRVQPSWTGISQKWTAFSQKMNRAQPGSRLSFGLRLGAFFNSKLKKLIVMDLYLVSNWIRIFRTCTFSWHTWLNLC